MSRDEMKKQAARKKMGQKTPGPLGKSPQTSDAFRNMGMAGPLSDYQLPFTSAHYGVGSGPIAVAVGDFTGNGNQDIVAANAHDISVSILLNNGDGTFTDAQGSPYDVGAPFDAVPSAVAVGDFTGNGNLDIVTTTTSAFGGVGNGSITVLLGNGDGTFQDTPLLFHILGAWSPMAVAVGDFTGDGIQDIVTGNQDGSVTVLLSTGDLHGLFEEQNSFSVGQGPVAVAVGDVTGNGYLDIATASQDGTVTVLLNTGDGSGSFQPSSQTYRVGSYPNAVTVGDVTGNGYLDIVTANYNDNTVSLLLNTGDGSGTFQAQKTFPVGFGPTAVAVGDLDHDGNLDIVTANIFDNTVSLLQGKGDGTFVLYQFYPAGAFPIAVAVGDLDQDGYQDSIVTANFSANTVTALLPPSSLVVRMNPIQATATVPFNGAIAIIKGASSSNDTTATIDWGDGTPTTSGTVSANPDNTLTVSGTHTYTTVDTFSLTVTVAEGTSRGKSTGQAMVSLGPTVQVATIYPTEQVDFLGSVATISGTSSSDFINATIDWGDGTSGQPNVFIDNSDSTLSVIAEHTYLTPGTFTLTVNVTVNENNVQGTGQAIVLPGLEMQVNTIQATAQVPFSGAVATISGASSASDTTAYIDWGDGLTTSVPVSANPDGTLTANGAHTYTAPGTYTLNGDAYEGNLQASGTGQAIVQAASDVQVVGVPTIQATAHVPFHGTVATIKGVSRASDTTVMIHWGDGTAPTPGILVANRDGTLTVRGSHTYNRGGTFYLSVTVREGARIVTGRGQVIVKAARPHARAFGVQSLTPPQGPFGDVSLPSTCGTRTVTVPSVRLPGNNLRVSAITDRVSGELTTTPPLASASSSLGALHAFGIAASSITTTAHADLSRLRGLRGTTTFATLSVGGTTFPPNFAPAANQVVPFADGSGTVTLNEQTLTRRANELLIVVNALHIRITTGPHAGTDIVVGHVEAGITLS